MQWNYFAWTLVGQGLFLINICITVVFLPFILICFNFIIFTAAMYVAYYYQTTTRIVVLAFFTPTVGKRLFFDFYSTFC